MGIIFVFKVYMHGQKLFQGRLYNLSIKVHKHPLVWNLHANAAWGIVVWKKKLAICAEILPLFVRKI